MSVNEILLPLAGGALIGTAALLLYGTLGRIAGISGISYGLLWGARGEFSWRLAFCAGLLAGGWLAAAAAGLDLSATPAGITPAWLVLLAGVLVGFGTHLGNGCTSGHGVCGLARLSPRSLAAVACFMATGMLTATLLRPLLI